MKHLPERVRAMMPTSRKWRAVSIFLSVCLVTFVSATIVQADTTPTVFYACVNMSNGTIRMISATDSCKGNEQKISWNNVGPAGPAGPAGPQGPQGNPGPQGPSGLSNGFSVEGSAIGLLPGDGSKVLVTLTLPNQAGNYIVNASATFGNRFTTSSTDVDCLLIPDRGPEMHLATTVPSLVPPDQTGEASVSLTTSYVGVATITLTCQTSQVEVVAFQADITAIQVNTLNGSQT